MLWTAFAVVAAVIPITRAIVPTWLPQAILLTVIVLLAGWFVRRSRHPGWAVVAEALAWIVVVVWSLPSAVPRLIVLPSWETLPALDLLLGGVVEEVRTGVAPLMPSSGLRWTLVATTGLLAIAIAHVALTARLPLLAAVGLIAVSVTPTLIVPTTPDPALFAPLAAAILLMLRADTRARVGRGGSRPTAAGTLAATVVGAIVLAATMIAVPLLPEPALRPVSGIGTGTGIDATLDLGSSLRQPQETEVLRLTTDAPTAPYLRIATMSSFDGDVWTPDAGGLAPVADGFPPPDEITAAETTTSVANVDVTSLTSRYLPVPYPAVSLEGARAEWGVSPANRTVTGAGQNSLGEEYTVQWERLVPTREQARAATAGGPQAPPQSLELPEVPEIVPRLAAEVTAGAQTPYDALSALQSWFRGGEFEYSLEAPVEAGFDGSGLEAMQGFLEARAGYCVHFASTFAVMARTLGIPSRVVLGYLPGTATGERVDGLAVYSVASTQLHAWPEAYLDGLGWVPFEPTASLGSPTSFLPEGSGAGPDPVDELEQPEPEQPEPEATPTQQAQESPGAGAEEDGQEDEADGAPSPGWLVAILALLLLLSAPFAVRTARRRRREAAGAARASWQELVDVAIDAGVEARASDTPRELGRRLVEQRGAPREDVAVLVGDVERAAFAPRSTRTGDDAARRDARAAALRSVRAALLPGRSSRLRAAVLPRSLVIRPGLGSTERDTAPRR
jgi:transglutaminase-like putative cysteine protease